jgi:hypothetical protein
LRYIGDLAGNVGQIPLNVKEGDYSQVALNLGIPLVTGAIGGIGTRNTAQFVNNLVNPLAGTSNPLKSKNFKSEIDWGKWNKEIPDNKALIQEYNAIEQQAKSNNTWMKNPDGSAFQGTPEQFVQQNSENFKKAYSNGFNQFNRGSRFHTNILNPEGTIGGYDGITFGGNEYMAKQYTVNDATTWKFNEHPDGAMAQTLTPNKPGNGGLYNLYQKNSKNSLVIDGKGADYQSINAPELSDSPVWTDWIASHMKNKNIDNVRINNIYDGTLNPGDVFINNNKKGNYLKSMWGNNGMFDMTNPNIYKSIAPAAIGLGAASQVNEFKQTGGTINNNMKTIKLKSGKVVKAQTGLNWNYENSIINRVPDFVNKAQNDFNYNEYENPTVNTFKEPSSFISTKTESKRIPNYLNPNIMLGLNAISEGTGLLNRFKDEKEWARLHQASKAEGFTPNPRFYSGMEHVQNINPIMQSGGKLSLKKEQVPIYSESTNRTNYVPAYNTPKYTEDSDFEDVLEFVDPTGLSSWDDVYRAVKDPSVSIPEAGLEAFGAVPLIGKSGKILKGAKSLAKELLTNPDFWKKTTKRGMPVGPILSPFPIAVYSAPFIDRGKDLQEFFYKKNPRFIDNKQQGGTVTLSSGKVIKLQGGGEISDDKRWGIYTGALQDLEKAEKQYGKESNVYKNQLELVKNYRNSLPAKEEAVALKPAIENNTPITEKDPDTKEYKGDVEVVESKNKPVKKFKKEIKSNIQKKENLNDSVKTPLVGNFKDENLKLNTLKENLDKYSPSSNFKSKPIIKKIEVKNTPVVKTKTVDNSSYSGNFDPMGGYYEENPSLNNNNYSFNDIINFGKRGFQKIGLIESPNTEIKYKPQIKTDNQKYKKFQVLGTTKDLGYSNNDIYSYVHDVSNDTGFNYIPTPVRKDKTGKIYNNVEGVGHFLLDASVAKGKKYTHPYSENMINNAIKNKEIIPVFKYNKNGDMVNVKYKTINSKKDLKAGEFLGAPLRSVTADKLNFDKFQNASGFKGDIRSIRTVDGKELPILKKGVNDNSYGRFTGGSYVLNFKNKNGKLITRNLAGSINALKGELEDIKKSFNISDKDISVGYHDVGSFSAKIKAKNNSISENTWNDFNPEPFTGGALLIPKQQLGGNVYDQKGYLKSNLSNFTPKKVIQGDANGTTITTNGMAFPILANGKKLFPNTGEYRFKESFVEEVPMYQKGGETFEDWYKTVPVEKNDTSSYNLRRAYELAPKKQLDEFVNNPKSHLYTAYENPQTGIYEFMKSKNHPTLNEELKWYNSNDKEAINFRKNYKLDTSGDYYKYIPVFKKGGCITLSSGKKVMQKGGDVEEDEVDYSDITFRMQEMENRFTEAFGPSKKQVEDVEDDEEDDDVDTEVLTNESKKGKKFNVDKNLKSSDSKINMNTLNKGLSIYGNLINEASKTYGVPSALLTGLLYQESRFNPNIEGPMTKYGKARGIAQFIDATAIEEGVDQFDPNSAIPGAARFLKKMYNKTGDWNLALASYNAGYGNVKKHNGIPPFKETINYVAIINKVADVLNKSKV